MKIVFFGTADFAVPCLESLLSNHHEVLAVVTQPDKPTGRGMHMSESPVKKCAINHGLPVLQPKRVRFEKFIERIRGLAPDVIVVAAFGQIMPQALLDIPPLGPINVHGSLLPKYRGAAPIQRALMNGETVTGVTTMWMDATLDTGDILLKAELPIAAEDTAGTLFPRLAEIGADLLIRTLDQLAANTIVRLPQDNSLATQSPMITPEDGAILWGDAADTTVNRIRAVSPRPGAYAVFNGKRVKIWQASVVAAENELEAAAPGVIVQISKRPAGLLVAAGSGSGLLIAEVQPEGGKRMPADAWARGARISPGDRFETA